MFHRIPSEIANKRAKRQGQWEPYEITILFNKTSQLCNFRIAKSGSYEARIDDVFHKKLSCECFTSAVP